MTKLLNVEEEERGLPILCIFGEYTRLLELFIKENTDKFRIIFIASKKPQALEGKDSIYFLSYEESDIIQKLEETIDYALVYLSKEETKRYLPPLFSKFSKDRAQILFLFYAPSFEKLYDVILAHKNAPNVRFAIMGELLSRNNGQSEGVLSKIIDNAISKRQITFGGNDLYSVYPVSLSDAMTNINRLLLGSFRNDTIYNLFYRHPETVLAAAHLIGRVEPDIKIIFSDTTNQQTGITREGIALITKSKLQMKEEYVASVEGFEKGVERIFQNSNEELTTDEESLLPKTTKKNKRKSTIVRAFKLSFLSLTAGLFLFLFLNLLFLGVGLLFLKSAIKDIESDNFVHLSQNAKNSKILFKIVKPTADLTFGAISPIDKAGKVQETFSLLEKATELADITGQTFNQISNAKNSFSEKTLMSSVSNISFLFQEGQRITLEQNNKVLSTILKSDYSKLLSLSSIFPQLLGFDNEKNYLLLFQNTDELRPTGGFIGSVGELEVNKGKVDNLDVRDVYELDGQLKNHVEPPFIVRRYLQPHLYLRDSNFPLNFQESASASAYLYNLETGKKPDAVIAINLDVLQKIMEISGPVALPTYKTTVTSDNIANFLEGTIQKDNFPGSTQKKDVLNSVLNQLILRFSSNSKDYIALIKLLPSLLEEKDILVSFSDNDIQKIFSANNYGGEGSDKRTANSKSVNDYLAVNEANIGVNKANAHVTREVTYETEVGESALDSNVTLSLFNNNPSDDYKTYIELAVPKGSQIQTVTIDNVKQSLTNAITDPKIYEAKNFKVPAGLEVEQYIHNDHTIFAFIATVKRSTKSNIKISYHNAAGHELSTIADYSLLYIKQPGTKPYKLTTILNYPDTYSPTDTHADSYGKNFLQEENIITKDFTTAIELKKKTVEK